MDRSPSIFIALTVLLLLNCNRGSKLEEPMLVSLPDTATLARAYAAGDFGSPRLLTPMEFLQILADSTGIISIPPAQGKSLPILTMRDDFPEKWITPSDVDQLIPLMYSRQPCMCFANPLSSHLPVDSSAEIGGFALIMVEAFKTNRKVDPGLYSCPKADQERADQLRKWWEQHHN